MSSYITAIQTSLRGVVNDFLATTLQYRTMTSGYGVETRTYSSWTTVGAVVTKKTHAQEYDEVRGEWVRRERMQIRTDDSFSLKQGDQFRLATDDAQIWAVDSRASGGPGSYLYLCARDIGTLVSGGNRGGGI